MTKRGPRKAAQVEPIASHLEKMAWDPTRGYLSLGCRVTGVDTCVGVSDEDIGVAVLEEPILLNAAKRLSKTYGRVIARADIEARIVASPRLQNVHGIAQQLRERLLIARCHEAIAQHAEAEHNRELARDARVKRNRGPRCGARTRSGRPCKRKVVLGRTRCPNHGGCSTGPTSLEGKLRIVESNRRRGARRRGKQ